ncbi:MAG: TetR/AcrR family transcriptional regulator [Actinomycetota bacterium]
MGLREENAELRRQRILAATRDLIARDGVDGWSMRKVAAAARVSVPTLYNLFDSKEQIRVALCAEFFEELDRSAVPDGSPERPLDMVLALVGRSVDQVVERERTSRPSLLAQEAAGVVHRTAPMAIERYRAGIQAAMDAGQLRTDLDAGLLAASAYDGFYRAAIGWARGALDLGRFRSAAIAAVCLCLLAVATDDSRPQLLIGARGMARGVERSMSAP